MKFDIEGGPAPIPWNIETPLPNAMGSGIRIVTKLR